MAQDFQSLAAAVADGMQTKSLTGLGQWMSVATLLMKQEEKAGIC
jgi:hypothetical protein